MYYQLLLLLTTLLHSAYVSWCCPAEVCICKWKGGKQTVECGGQQLPNIPEGMDPGTQVLNFSGNALQVLQSERFLRMDLLNLQKIYLSRNQLIRIHEKAFRGLSNLVELDLSDNALQQVPSETFQDYSSLMRLTLSGNPIRELKASAFRHLSFLTTLELSNCQIERVENEAFVGMDNLEWLRLDGNRIGFIQGAHILPKALHGISLHSNRWMCDCRLLDVHAWLSSYVTPQSEEPRCVEPARLKGQTIKSLKKDELACLPEVSPTSSYTEISEGRNISIVCVVRAIPEPKVLWLFNGQVMSNDSFMDNLHMYYYIEESGSAEEKRSEMFIYNVGADDNGTFSCVGINVAGTSFSNYTLRVIIKEPPVVNEVSFPRDYMNYIIASSTGGGLLIFAILGTIVIKCKQRKRSNKRSKKYAMSGSGVTVTNVNGSGNSTNDSAANDTGLMKCSSLINGDVDSLNGSGGLIMTEGLTPTKLCKENGVIIGGQMKQNLLLYAPVAQYQQQQAQAQHLEGVTLGGPGSLQLGASNTPPPTSSLIMSSNGLAYCSPPGSVRNYQEKNPDLVHDAAESVKHQTLKNVSGSIETDFDAASDCSGPCSIQGMTITQAPVQYENCYQLIRPSGLANNMNATRFTAMSTLPRGLQLKTLMSGMGASTTLGVMTQQTTPHQVDVHLNPVCFLGQEGLMAYDYSNQHGILQQPQQQPQHILSPLQNATAQAQQHQQQQQQKQQQQQNFYRTLPHNRAHKQQQFAAATAGNNNMRYSLEAEFLQQHSNTPTYDKYLPNVRFTAEGYPQAQPQYPSPPEGYKTSSPSNVPVSSCGSLDTMAAVGSMPTFQQWPPCLPGFQVQPIRYPPTIVGVLSPQPQQQLQTPSTSLSQALTTTSQTQTPVIASGSDSISVAATATISGTSELKKRCVAAQADNSIIPEGDESQSVSPTNSLSTTATTEEAAAAVRPATELCSASKSEQQSTTKLRHLNGPLADSPDEGYVGEAQESTDI